MARTKEPYTVPKKKSTAPEKHNAPWVCKWWETVTDQQGTREIRKSKWFATRKEAVAHGEQKANQRLYSDIRQFTDTERAEYLHFKLECEGRGLNTKEVFTAGLKHFKVEKFKAISLEDGIECYAIWMTSWQYAEKTIKGSINNVKWLLRKSDPDRQLSTFTAAELIQLATLRYPDHHNNRVSFLKELRGLFRYAAKEGNCSPTIHKEAFLPNSGKKTSVREADAKRADNRKPRFTVEQIKIAFASVDPHYHQILALGIFAGLRPESELMNIQWSMEENGHHYGINFEQRIIHVHKTWASKIYDHRRITDLPEIFWTIMERADDREGRVSPVNYTNLRRSVFDPIKAALGWSRWPTDVMRHTALSFQNVLVGQAITMNNAGHTDPRTFYKYYNNAVSGTEAAALQALEL